MIQLFVDRFMTAKPEMLAGFKSQPPESYDALFARVVRVIACEDDYASPDPTRITAIDHGDYQGTRVFIVGASGYQPASYWGVGVSYGSCSGCDSFEAVRCYSDEPISDKQAEQFWVMCLHMVQGLKQFAGTE